jgi:hypothetical protein
MATLGRFIQQNTLKKAERDEAGTFIVPPESPKIQIQYLFSLEPRLNNEKKRLSYLNKYKNGKEKGNTEPTSDITED